MIEGGWCKWLGVVRFSGGTVKRGSAGEEKRSLTCYSPGRRRGVSAKCTGPKGKMLFGEGSKTLWADWVKWGGGGQRGKVGQLERVGLAGLDPKRWMKLNFDFSNFNEHGNLLRLWEFLQGVIDGIWTWRFFLNSSILLKDF
jgi:hypothetical protein